MRGERGLGVGERVLGFGSGDRAFLTVFEERGVDFGGRVGFWVKDLVARVAAGGFCTMAALCT